MLTVNVDDGGLGVGVDDDLDLLGQDGGGHAHAAAPWRCTQAQQPWRSKAEVAAAASSERSGVSSAGSGVRKAPEELSRADSFHSTREHSVSFVPLCDMLFMWGEQGRWNIVWGTRWRARLAVRRPWELAHGALRCHATAASAAAPASDCTLH
jgi:hypothetical protein